MRRIDVCFDSKKISVRIVVDAKPDSVTTEIADEIEGDIEVDYLEKTQSDNITIFKSSIEVTVVLVFIPISNTIGEYSPFDGECATVFARYENMTDVFNEILPEADTTDEGRYWKTEE
jgi:hypothetical protein